MSLVFRTNRRRPYWGLDDDYLPVRLFDQHFGSGLFDEDILAPALIFGHGNRPRHFRNREASGLSEMKVDKDKFQVNLDVQQFKPEELSVKTVDNCVVIEGKHEEKADEHGYIKRHFVRRYVLPDNCKQEEVQCQLSSDGVLQIQVARQPEALPSNQRSVPIQETGTPAIPQNSSNAQQEGGDVQMK